MARYRVWAVVDVHDPAKLIAHGKRVFEAGGGEAECVETVEDALIRAIVSDADDTAPLDFGVEILDQDAAQEAG